MLMIEPGCFAAIRRTATACAAKNAARTLRLKMASKSSTLTSGRRAGRFMPALLTRMWNGSALWTGGGVAVTSVTASRSASALSPRARIAAAAASISACVRAASVTCAPAAASAEAAASPMPRPPPVTSARRPSRRNEGVFVRSMVIPGTRICSPDGAKRHPGSFPAFRFAPCGLLGLFGRAGEEKQISVRILDDECPGAPRFVAQRLIERHAFRLELEVELLDLRGRVQPHVGRQQAFAVAQFGVDHRPVHVAQIDQAAVAPDLRVKR